MLGRNTLLLSLLHASEGEGVGRGRLPPGPPRSILTLLCFCIAGFLPGGGEVWGWGLGTGGWGGVLPTTGPLSSPVDCFLQLQNTLSPSTGIFYHTADLRVRRVYASSPCPNAQVILVFTVWPRPDCNNNFTGDFNITEHNYKTRKCKIS